MYYRMYYPGLPAFYCANDLACPRLGAPTTHRVIPPYSRGYLVSRAAYLKLTFAMTSLTQAFPGAKKPASAYTLAGFYPSILRGR